MKKLMLFMSLLVTIIAISFASISVKASTWLDETYDNLYAVGGQYKTVLNTDFTLESTVGTFATTVYYAFHETDELTDDITEFLLLADVDENYRQLIQNGVTSKISFYDDITDTWVDFDLYQLYRTNYTNYTQEQQFNWELYINFKLDYGISYYDGSNEKQLFDLSVYDITKIRTYIVFDTTTVDYNVALAYYQNTDNVYVFTVGRRYTIELYQSLNQEYTLIKTLTVIGDSLADEEINVFVPEGYEFFGWGVLDGSLFVYDLDDLRFYNQFVLNNMELVGDNYVLKLYTRYIIEGTIVGGPPVVEAPSDVTGIRSIFAVFGMDNSTGYTLIFIFIIFFLFIMFAVLQLPLIVYFIGSVSITLLWLFVGFLPIFLTIIILLIEIISFFGLKMNNGGN